jgi:hypothetical protein
MIISHSILLRTKNVSDKIRQEKIKIHTFMFNKGFFENRAVYEIMWENTVQPDRPQLHYGACSLHAGYLRLQTHTQNM